MAEPTILSLLPPALTIFVAITTRRVLLSLALGVFVGMTIHAGFNPFLGIVSVLEQGVFFVTAQASNAKVIVLMFIIGGFVRLLETGGGMEAFTAKITRRIRTPAKAQLAVWFSGMSIFFTDSGNSLILGPLFQPIFDKLNICREKLAFIIDATSSTVCVLVPFISWGVYIMSLIDAGHTLVDRKVDAFDLLVQALPFQMYPWLALLSVAVFSTIGRDFGPMQRAQLASSSAIPPPPPSASHVHPQTTDASAAAVVVPIGVVFIIVVGLFTYYYVTLGKLPGAKIYTSLVLAYLTGSVALALVQKRQSKVSLSHSATVFTDGMKHMMSIVLVVVFAWSLGRVCGLLDTGAYVATVLGGNFPQVLLPALIFVIGGIISLSTGSSYGTFAILMPIAIPLAHSLHAPMPITIAAVLSGGILGDHASPISDTTILSSMATGCPHAQHVNTQLPYALVIGSAALLAFLLAGITAHPLSIIAGLVALIALIFGATRPRTSPSVKS